MRNLNGYCYISTGAPRMFSEIYFRLVSVTRTTSDDCGLPSINSRRNASMLWWGCWTLATSKELLNFISTVTPSATEESQLSSRPLPRAHDTNTGVLPVCGSQRWAFLVTLGRLLPTSYRHCGCVLMTILLTVRPSSYRRYSNLGEYCRPSGMWKSTFREYCMATLPASCTPDICGNGALVHLFNFGRQELPTGS